MGSVNKVVHKHKTNAGYAGSYRKGTDVGRYSDVDIVVGIPVTKKQRKKIANEVREKLNEDGLKVKQMMYKPVAVLFDLDSISFDLVFDKPPVEKIDPSTARAIRALKFLSREVVINYKSLIHYCIYRIQ